MRTLRSRLNYANVIATVALFIALGGSSYAAAVKITGHDVKNGSLTGKDIKKNSITGADVKKLRSGDVTNGSLLAKDFKAGQLPAGARGPQGPKGDKGDTGPQGPPGTPDTSNFYTKTESDARFAPLGAAGNELDIPGTAFVTIDSATTLGSNDYFGVYEKTGRQYLSADLQALPRDARITSVDFFLIHNNATQAEVDLSQANPESNTSEGYVKQLKVTAPNPNVQRVTLDLPAPGYRPGPGIIPLLFWYPGVADNTDILYGVRVHYTLD